MRSTSAETRAAAILAGLGQLAGASAIGRRRSRVDGRHQRGARAEGRPRRAGDDRRVSRTSSASAGRPAPSSTTSSSRCPDRSSDAALDVRRRSSGSTRLGPCVTPLTDAEIQRVVSALDGSGADVVAVCLLHAYANPSHEAWIARALRADGWTVSTSHEVLPEYREFERWSTTVVNAYVTPLIDRYLATLEAGVGRRRLSVMQSNGGSISAAAARAQAVRTVLVRPCRRRRRRARRGRARPGSIARSRSTWAARRPTSA